MLFLEGSKLRAILIKEGKSVNGNRWTRSILEQIANLSNGVPIHFYDMSKKGDASFGHHWEALRMRMPPGIRRLLPEKLPGSQVGLARNAVVENDSKGLAQVVADVETPEGGWFSSMVESLNATGKRMGLSIFVPERGIKFLSHPDGTRTPTEVTEVVSFDAVSQPSAGGQLMPALEALGQPKEDSEMKWKNLVKRLRSLVPGDKRQALDKDAPDGGIDTVAGLLEANDAWVNTMLELRGHKVTGDARTPFLEALLSTTPEDPKDDPAPDKSKKKGTVTPTPTPTPATIEAVTREEFTALNDTMQGLVKTASHSLLEARINAGKLPAALQEFTRQQFTPIIEASGVIEGTAVDTFITNLKKSMGDSQNPTLESVDIRQAQTSTGEEWLAAYRGMFADVDHVFVGEGDNRRKIPAYKSIRRAYADFSGDVHCDGRDFYIANRGRGRSGILESIDPDSIRTVQEYQAFSNGAMEAVIGTAMFPLITSEELHQAVLREYAVQSLDWKLVASPETVSDFKTWHWLRIGEFPNLPVVKEYTAAVAEDDYYKEWAGHGPNEEEITLKIEKKGGLFAITWENIVDDMTRRFQKYPQKIARAAMRTVNDEVFGLIVDNGVIYDTDTLGHAANHGNLISAAYSYANIKTMRKDMAKQRDIGWSDDTPTDQGGVEMGRVKMQTVFCGSDLYDQVYEDLFSDGKPILSSTETGEPGFPNSTSAADPLRSLAGTNENQRMPNVLRSKWGIQLADAQQYIDDNDADMYFGAADPNIADMIKVGFFRGRQDPELFVQDMQNVGTFFDKDVITHKVRHIYKAAVADYRGFQIGIP